MLYHKADSLLWILYVVCVQDISLSPPSILTTHEASLPCSQLFSLSYILVLMYIDATLQPMRLLTYLLKRLHLHFLRSMHSQDVTRWILPVTSRDNRNYFCLHVLPCDRKSSSLPSTEEAKSSFFHPACITCSQKRHVETSWREEEMGQVKGSGEVGWGGGGAGREKRKRLPANTVKMRNTS